MPDTGEGIDERKLLRAWQQGVRPPCTLVDGRPLHVVYRGRCLGGAGPDVRGALLAFGDGSLVEGDVEFHRRTSDWFAHGHDHDPHYRAVILHVVLVADVPPPLDPSGRPIATLVLTGRIEANGVDQPAETTSCHQAARDWPAEALGALLDDLGDRRLAQRAARFEADLARLSPDQLAYEALCEALGFSRNRASFVRLAQAAPISLLVALIGRRPEPEALDLAQAILLGVAGLLPSQRGTGSDDWDSEREARELEAIWELFRREWEGVRLTAADWVFGGVRPANYPTRRIAGAAQLIVRYRAPGLDQALLAPLAAAEPTATALERALLVDDPTGYWAHHADFGRLLPRRPAALLGRDRAGDVVINVVLPLALAIAAASSQPDLATAAWSVYRASPRLAAYQAAESLATEIGVSTKTASTARRQQGLLYLLRNHCEQAACLTCPLARTPPLRPR